MDVTCCSALLLKHTATVRILPQEVLETLRSGDNVQYLEVLSQLALDPAYTTTIFTTHEPLSVEICSRWLLDQKTDDLSALAALARILPAAPHLSVYATNLLSQRRGVLRLLSSRQVTALDELPLDTLEKLLLALCRLLRFDNEAFAFCISPAQLQIILHHANPSIKYLTIRILCLYIHASDASLVSMVRTYIGDCEVPGRWEDQIIDYTFFSLWEEKRLKDLDRSLQNCSIARSSKVPQSDNMMGSRAIETQDFSDTVACIGGTLVPRSNGNDVGPSSISMTKTTRKNLRSLVEGIKSSKPLLVSGSSGVGKTAMIKDIARELGRVSTMITLHLNEQTDAKLLIGMYTSAKTPGSFSWRPGVLTTAVMEGQWVFVEDLDRAPAEIISTMLPLLERRELLVPNWGQSVRAAPGFKLIASMRSSTNLRGELVMPAANMLGLRHWLHVVFDTPPDEELAEIIIQKFPLLRAYVPRFMNVYHTLRSPGPLNIPKPPVNINPTKPIGPQDLLRWCRRVQSLLSSAGIISGEEPISEAISDNIFLEAIDCFAGACPQGSQKTEYMDSISQGLHMPAERVRYCLDGRKPKFLVRDSTLSVGRTVLAKRRKPPGYKSSYYSANSPFAITDHVTKVLESIAATVNQAEPCLLVGETGTGKTTIVQRLAAAMDQQLTVVNLSQQSAAGDLLGGYKPINMRALAVPIKEEFDELLGLTFNSEKNRTYIDALGKLVSKGRWTKALALWQDALRVIDDRFGPSGTERGDKTEKPQFKRRRLQSSKFRNLKIRWDKFASDVQVFRMHLLSGSKGFAFSFVESKIVKAARNGDWVLLDEINLASPDTLESLADLFSPTVDGSPSILLTESGDAERIYANENFRIFGAMNPATDVGKQNLPLSLRSRFTELYVEGPDNDLENLLAVIKAYLGNHHYVDVRAATDIAQLYLDIQKIVSENRLVDGANQKPHFSLRTLTRTLMYILDTAPVYGLRRAVLEGFSMGFLTVLNADSEQLVQPLIDKHVFGGQKNSHAYLRQTPRLPQDGRKYVQFGQYWIAQGALPTEKQAQYIITPFIEHNLLSLIRATSTRRFPVLLQGPTSSGKTSMVEYLAKLSGNKFVRINNHEHTDLQEYLGAYVSDPDGRLQYQDGVLVQALREGSWVVLDELNLAPTDVLEALNRLLDDNRELFIPETQQVVKPHATFMLFATQNPPGIYGGRKVLSRAFRSRFLELHFDDIPENELETILYKRSQIAPPFCSRIVAVYKKLSTLRQNDRLFEQSNSFATLRDLFRWAFRDANDREQLAVNGFLLLAERVRNQDERFAVKKVIEDIMRVTIDEGKLFATARIENTAHFQGPLSSSIVWTKSMRRLFVLVSEALKKNEPVLLVGETGSGKTTMCQFISEMMGTKLNIVNAHQNMETSDLIGAQRPIRNKDNIFSQLTKELKATLKDRTVDEEDYRDNLPQLLELYEKLQREQPESISEKSRVAIENGKTKANSLFEWADGSLVTAMRNGEHFLLDEISLADDSVLERLNSVLEPGRTLFLAEKGTSDEPLEAAPGFQFLATMNPGGDYGKRELSPALRNRFTEIWVPSASSEEEILEIAQAKLAPQLTHLSKPIVAYATWFSTTYNIAAPHISIRDLLAWVHFVNFFQQSSLGLGILHGAAMVYVDGLGANPASKSSIADTMVLQERNFCLSKLDEVFGHDLSSIYSQTYQLWSDDTNVGIGPFSLKRAPGLRQDPRYSLQAPTTTANALKIIRALQLKKPILIEGSPGVGKTTLVAALANVIGTPLTRINLSDQTDLMDLFGSDSPLEGTQAGHFGWRDAPFLRAMKKGEWVLLDEMNLASQSVLEGLNACLDHRGEVYISELDQVFERHPDFVVFAAQNPHHQGGGRKGLPASFVNRFTVVYADTFTLQDLMIISHEIFPDVTDDDREGIVHTVTALSKLLQQNRNYEAHGGPWEMNLRDILRWLHLLATRDGLLPFASLSHFQELIILQRFRNPEDVVAISHLLRRQLPQNQPHDYFHSSSESLLEVGLALLPRDQEMQPISTASSRIGKSNLAISEYVMLCVQNNWPCLLVGAPSSGKSTLIFQLARSIGADILEIPMNSEMDTMDLIGGFEQLDPQREFSSFLKRLRKATRRAMVQELRSKEGLSEETLILEAQLQSQSTEPVKVVEAIRNGSKGRWGPRFVDFLEEGEDFLRQTKLDNRTCFEWVDGILVKALKQGKWVILDNANLCNPSVLDRLNSLLEPNGVLSINEHRNSDGSAKVVQPHKNFKLFMTIDPRHGELSRAMRNRSVELFLPAQSQSPSIEVLGSSCEPTVSRFRLFQAFDWKILDDSRFRCILTIIFDHLTPSDLKLCHLWEAQVKSGMMNVLPSQQIIFSSIVKTYCCMFDHEESILRKIVSIYDKMEAEMVVPAPGFASIQPINPFNNPYLLPPANNNQLSSNLHWLGSCFEVLLDIYGYLHKFMSIDEKLISEQIPARTPLTRSMVSYRTNSFQNDTTRPLAPFLQEMGESLRHALECQRFEDVEDRERTLFFIRDVFAYLRDIFDLANSPHFNEANFQVYQNIGRSICAVANVRAHPQTLSMLLARELRSKLDTFNSSWQLSSGLGMEELWAAFRPATAMDIPQLEFSLRVKGLADQFDALKFNSGASFQELENLERSMVQMHGHAGNATLQPLTEIEKGLEDLKSRTDVSTNSTLPYFQSQLKVLRQYHLRCNSSDASSLSLLGLLAGRPTRESMSFEPDSEGWDLLSQLNELTATSDPTTALASIRGILPISMLQKLKNTNEVPLQSLGLFRTELDVAAKTIAASTRAIQTNQVDVLFEILQRIQSKLQEVLDSRSHADSEPDIGQLLQRFGGNSKDAVLREARIAHFRLCLQSTTKLPNLGERLTSNHQSDRHAIAASTLVQLFTGCLLLYVPDRPFDPALRVGIEQARRSKREAEFRSRLCALRDFELVFSGRESSFRIELAEKDLQTLGVEPEVALIARPLVSEITNLQIEYNNILSTIVLRSPDSATLQQAIQGHQNQVQEIKLVRANISQAITRLSQSFHGYEDINKPLVAMLQGLNAGLAFALLAGTRTNLSDDAIKKTCETTPLLSAGPVEFFNAICGKLQTPYTNQADSSLHLLRSVAVARNVNQASALITQHTVFEAFHNLYEEWKERLSHDQRRAAALSSLYRYRGSEEGSDEADNQDFRLLFPDYEHSSEEGYKEATTKYDPRQQAGRLAQLQRDIFHAVEPPSVYILALVRGASHSIAGLWHAKSNLTQSPVPAEDMLSALVLSLDENRQSLSGSAAQGKVSNFYTDANLPEAQKLIQLTRQIQLRFTELQQTWPEHATPGHVLRISAELLALRHTEPVAKLLTKAEQLHSNIHEWQSVASKQYTAITVYDKLTELLISWRRLELSTWARLLDMEDQKCYDDADAWWFMAYEVIVAAPLSLIDSGDDVRIHSEQLVKSLSDFLLSTSMGQYSHRLNLISCFKDYLEALEHCIPAVGVVHNAVTNLINYFSHFKSPIQQFLHQERQSLEKDVKEILLLASWKDTNINALHDSARRSHHKLFKVVRKYRILLTQSSETVIAQGIPRRAELCGQPASPTELAEVDAIDVGALEFCQQRLTTWSTKPERFTNAAATARRMHFMGQLPSTMIDANLHLHSFGTELIESISSLRKETPLKATKSNSDLIKYLKARKRKVFADTLKAIRQMGFRSNTSADALAKQSSLGVILTNSPALTDGLFHEDFDAAEYHFYRLVNIMPHVRGRAENHSEELTRAEIGRSLGYLEGMISMILRQRTQVASVKTELKSCSSTIEKLQNLWAPDHYSVSRLDVARTATVYEMPRTLRWLHAIAEAGSIIIEKHGKLGGIDPSATLTDLNVWKQRILATLLEFDNLPKLPRTLISSQHQLIFDQGTLLLQGFKAHLRLLIDKNPGLGFVLKQIERWTNHDIIPSDQHVNGRQLSDLGALEESVSFTADAILVAVQSMGEASSAIPTSDEHIGWLIHVEEALGGGLRKLHSHRISDLLEDVVTKVQQLNSQDEDDLMMAGALCVIAMPIFQQYRSLLETALARHLRVHRSVCELASLLANAFSEIAVSGFCSPTGDSDAQVGEQEKLEGGTGLGEGEGAEDISKDIQDDEDLSELAQGQNETKPKEDIDDQDDALNMDQDELEGEMGEGSENREDNKSASEGEDNGIDEETGSVDDLDPSAVDEKLWDGKADDAENDKKGSKSNGKAEKDEQSAADATYKPENNVEKENEDNDEMNEEGAEEGEEMAKEDPERMDPHAEQGQNLHLPEEMDLDDLDGSEGVSDISDMDGISDVEQEQIGKDAIDKQENDSGDDALDGTPKSPSMQSELSELEEGEPNNAEARESPIDAEPSDDGQQEDKHGALQDHSDDAAVYPDNAAPSDVKGLGGNADDQQIEAQAFSDQVRANKGVEGSAPDESNSQAAAADDQAGPSKERSEESQTQDISQSENKSSEAFKKLGDALEKWHRQNTQIKDATDQDSNSEPQTKDVDMADQDFEHLQNEEIQGDTQALGSATDEQACALDDEALNSEMHGETRDFPPEKADQEVANRSDEAIDDVVDTTLNSSETRQEQPRPSALIADSAESRRIQDRQSTAGIDKEEDIRDLDIDLSGTHLQPADEFPFRAADEARCLWSNYETLTRDLSLALTEQLRLILSPTTATKMRGDFRTGKRLNMKRIIPYIASNYKRDKIWMRRSIPSKRNYQIMLAVDDSKSMGESGSGQLAFETLALVAKSLSMLDVGEICIVSFGNEVCVAHDFDKPFSSEAGAQIFQHFGFQQTKTNIRKLVAESIALFREAKRKTFNAGTDLWQLELIISDGVCEDHDTIRRLVRQAQEERIMIVFVIVDADALLKGESIMDMKQVVFESDETGETKPTIKRYLDGFPFPYYLVVGNVKDLPGVLAQALRQWFAEVVESG